MNIEQKELHLAKAVAIEAVINYGILYFSDRSGGDLLEEIAKGQITDCDLEEYHLPDLTEQTLMDATARVASEAAGIIQNWQKRMDDGEDIVEFLWFNARSEEDLETLGGIFGSAMDEPGALGPVFPEEAQADPPSTRKDEFPSGMLGSSDDIGA